MPKTASEEIAELEQEHSRNPEGRLFVHLAEAYRRSGELDRARDILTQGLRHHADYTSAHVVLANVLTEQGDTGRAEQSWRRVLELDPENALALRALGDLARAAGGRERALEFYWQLFALDEDNEEIQQMITELSQDQPEAQPAAAPARESAQAPETAPGPRGAQRRREAPQPAAAPSGNGRTTTAPARSAQAPPAAALVPTGAASAAPGTDAIALAEMLVRLLEHQGTVFYAESSLRRLVATAIGREMGLDDPHINALALAALLADLGNLSLVGEGHRTAADEEGEAERRQVAVSLQLLQGITLPAGVHEALRHQYEHWDGRGAPDGVRGDEIPFAAQILAVARAAARLLAHEEGRTPAGVAGALGELQRGAGSLYNPVVVDVLRRVFAGRERHGIGYGWGGHVFIAVPEELRALNLASSLHTRGYVPEVASDVATARERLRGGAAEAVVLGAELPDGDTASLIRELRGFPQLATAPIVVIDADSPELRVSLLSAGADVCFARDVSFTEFKATLDALLRRTEHASGARDGLAYGYRHFA
jgi:tetratricopeptide (TPR) repeat protein/CheY-like chemotaxis protein